MSRHLTDAGASGGDQIGNATEAALASAYVTGHVGTSPVTGRQWPMSGFLIKDASGNVELGSGKTLSSNGVGTFLITNPADAGTLSLSVGTTSGFVNGINIYGGGSGTPNIIKFTTASVERMRIDASGNVGVGTTSPSEKIHGYVTGGNISALIESGAASGVAVSLKLKTSSRTWEIGQAPGVGDNTLTVYDVTAAAVRMQFLTTGHVAAGGDNTQTFGTASKRWSTIFAGTGTINTSDERAKTEIGDIPDAWLDAWGGVQWQRFKFTGGTRWHVGLIAQQVHAAFAAHDLDAFEIGLCCFDEWEEQREPVFENVKKTRLITNERFEQAGTDDDGNPLFERIEVQVEQEYEETVDTGETRVTLEAGDRWGLRYDECQAIEAAWNRRELSRMAARLAALEGA